MITFKSYSKTSFHWTIKAKSISMYIFSYPLQYVVKESSIDFEQERNSVLEINTLSILPSLLACATIQAAIKGLSLSSHTQMEKFFCKLIHCNKLDLIYTEHIIEQFFQSCIQCITPSPRRRCLAPIDTSPQQQRRTKVK